MKKLLFSVDSLREMLKTSFLIHNKMKDQQKVEKKKTKMKSNNPNNAINDL